MSGTKNPPKFKAGDTIKCRDADDAIRMSEELSESWDLYRFSLLQRRKTGLVAGSGERL